MTIPPGARFGPYEILELLGSGAVGDVYKAHDVRLDRFVAIKMLRDQLAGDPGSRRRFEQEARAISALNHPHICTLYDVGRQDDLDFLVMELVIGETLASRLATRGSAPLNDAVRYGAEIADALWHAHDRGVVHRDLKSANVIVTSAGATKVLDFGVAIRLATGDVDAITRSYATLSPTGTIAGTLGYMAPEVLQGVTADQRTDIWALGVLLYEMIAGVRPFRAPTPFELTSAILRDPPAPLSDSIPSGLQAVVHHCLEKDPVRRYRRADEVRVALENYRNKGPFIGGRAGAASSTVAIVPPRPTDAERRQVSVLCCDLAGSAGLSELLDAEQWRDLLRQWQERSDEAMRRFDGSVAQRTGHGFVAYFGYPRAHEDDAPRAVRAGLEIVHGVAALNRSLPVGVPGNELTVRVGIDTGLVVAEETAADARSATAVVGDAPSVATRLHALAPANSVVVSDRTLRLLHGAFEVDDLELSGVLSDLKGPFRVRRERRAEDRFEATHATRLTPLVGRDEELALLIGRWAMAKEGEGQVVALRGEPGIGKSRILRTLRERLASERRARVSYQCSPFFSNTAFYPVIEQIQRAADFGEDDDPETRLEKLGAWLASSSGSPSPLDAAPLLAAMLSLNVEGRTLPLALSPQRQKERTIEVIVEQLTGRAQAEPLLVVFEDVHWIDPTTAELLDYFVAQLATTRLLLLVTYRPTFEPSWTRYAHVTVHSLNRLSRRHCGLMATKVADKALPEALVRHIVEKTDGVPLFVEELTKAVIESNLVTDAGDRYELAGDVDMMRVPATLHDSLMARLDRLIPMREVAQIGAAIGREFSYRLLAAVSPMSDVELQTALERIVDSELVHRRGSPPDAVYVFKHALVQDAAYDSMLKRRRVELHHRIAEALERDFPNTVDTEPELIAHHYTAATATDKAVPYWLKAGVRALRASALAESVDHLSRGLKLLLSLPGSGARDAQELDFQANLGTAQMMWKGYANAATGEAYQRAETLLTAVGDSAQQFPVLWGVWAYYLVQPNYQQTLIAAHRALAVAERAADPGLLVQALSLNCVTMFWLGRHLEAKAFTERVLELYDERAHGSQVWLYNHDAKNLCFIYAAKYLWMLGYPDQAARADEERAAQARRLGHPFLIAFGDVWGSSVWHYRRDHRRHSEILRRVEELTEEQGYPMWEALTAMYQGAWLVQNDELDRGTEMLERSHHAYLATGAGNIGPYQRALLADAYSRSSRDVDARTWIDAAIDWMEHVDERCHEAEVHRLKGDILLRRTPRDEVGAEAAYVKSLAVARHQHARGWELRTATSLARLWCAEGRCSDAHDLLAPIFNWFTEGFDTKDLQDAKALLR